MAPHKEFVDILFFGDLVGRPGRRAVKWYLSTLREDSKPDVVIANAENASHGFGLSEKNYYELLDSGIHILTGGNHIWDRKELLDYIDTVQNIVRPRNFPGGTAGTGARIFSFDGFKVGVINLLGQVFMGNYNSPWEDIETLIADMREETLVIFLDFHAEATAEKNAFARYVSRLGVSAFTGTHTHVQTADERILDGCMGYITDSGFNGAYDSVIGMAAEPSIERLRTLYPNRLEVEDSDLVQVNATRYTVNVNTGVCTQITRVNLVHDLKEDLTYSPGDFRADSLHY